MDGRIGWRNEVLLKQRSDFLGFVLMKSAFALLLLTFALTFHTQGQTLLELNAKRLQNNRRGMLVLGSWAMSNIVYSGITAFSRNHEAQRFHEMNVMWNVVNLGIAIPGYLTSRKNRDLSLAESMRAQSTIEKSLLFNAGLDVGYMAGGLYLRELGRNRTDRDQQSRFMGWGKSLVLQGGFLFAYDIAMFIVHRRHGERGIMKLLDNVQFSGTGIGFNIPLEPKPKG